ncbi:ATP-binding protein [Leptotrichia sp. oral taxon 847]|uniref:ATP-binding protein n=1 Tax=Leptotrichia sp. oral taxon 847 TaxID=1785996 RepID=UPI00076840E9|nr:ATP-binding protein [Leptotrichia sp. oral taxon 847]AMD94724.1 ATPase [Leptotrichia sp. oral taxon 847]
MLKRDEYIKKIVPFIDKDVIKVLTGIRRSGKSVMLKLLMEELKNRGINENQFIHINFENLKYRNLKNYEKLYDFILNKVDDKYKSYYIFLDEIQEVEEWESCVNSLRVDEEFRFDIYITGSNAKLLSGELSTYLAGRYIEFVVYPFSFKEFFKIIQEKNQEIKVKEAFQKYIKFGGMPFLHNLDYNYEASMQYLQDLYASIILKDITQRNNIRDTDLLERILNYIVMNIGNTFSATSISKFFKSENRKVATETILNYIKAYEEAFLIYRVARNDLLGKKILNVNEKYYIADHGIREAIMENNQKNINQVLENIVYFEMLRRGYNVKIGKVDNLEIDFVCKKNDKIIYIQVSYLLASEDTKEKEFSVLENIKDNYPKYVLSMDEFDMSRNGIKHVNLIEFLTKEDS